jgi:hypothetical protein
MLPEKAEVLPGRSEGLPDTAAASQQ